jgi:hypothetical protein
MGFTNFAIQLLGDITGYLKIYPLGMDRLNLQMPPSRIAVFSLMPRDPNDKRPTGDLPTLSCACASIISAVLAFLSTWLNSAVGIWLWIPVFLLLSVFGFVAGWLGVIAGKHSWNWIGVAVAVLGLALHAIAILFTLFVLIKTLHFSV